MSKFDAALIILQGIVDCPGTQRLTIYEDFKADKLDEFKAAISVLEAAGKVDKAKSIEALNGYFAFLSIHGFTETDPLVVSVYALLDALPDEEEHHEPR